MSNNDNKTKKKVYTLSEIESQFTKTSISTTEPSASSTALNTTTNTTNLISKILAHEQKKREYYTELNNKQSSEPKNLMSKEEIDLIYNKQLLALMNDESFSADYYYERIKRKGLEKLEKSEKKSGEGKEEGKKNTNNPINSNILKTKNSVEIKGALGKISISAPTKPKQKLTLNLNFTKTENLNKKSLLLKIEDILFVLIQLDDLYFDYQNKNTNSKETSKDGDKDEMREFNLKYTKLIKQISLQHLNLLISFKKFRKSFKKLVFFHPDKLSLFKSLIPCLSSLIITNTNPKDILQELDEYCLIVYEFSNVLSGLKISDLEDLFKLVTEGLFLSKPGLVFFTLFLSRVLLTKSEKSEDNAKLVHNIYDFIFTTFKGKFMKLFPPLFVVSVYEETPLEVDDLYVWQFFSCLIYGLSNLSSLDGSVLERQRCLVEELRERIFEVVGLGEGKKERVNLFLNGLGLDVSMLGVD